MHVYLGSLGRAKKGDHMVQTDSGEPGGDDWGWHLITIAGVCLLALAVFLMYRGEHHPSQLRGHPQNHSINEAQASTGPCPGQGEPACREIRREKPARAVGDPQ